MSTHCNIAFKIPEGQPDAGKYRQIYVHFDGYFEGVGQTLLDNFNSAEDADKITALGDCSELAACVRIEPLGPHSYNKPEEKTIVAYHRDRGEEWDIVKPRILNSPRKDAEFLYVWEDGAWHFIQC